LRPVTLESRAEHTDRAEPSQDSGLTTYIIDLFMFIESTAPPAATIAAPQKLPDGAGRCGFIIPSITASISSSS
jgi:hypothetical protein